MRKRRCQVSADDWLGDHDACYAAEQDRLQSAQSHVAQRTQYGLDPACEIAPSDAGSAARRSPGNSGRRTLFLPRSPSLCCPPARTSSSHALPLRNEPCFQPPDQRWNQNNDSTTICKAAFKLSVSSRGSVRAPIRPAAVVLTASLPIPSGTRSTGRTMPATAGSCITVDVRRIGKSVRLALMQPVHAGFAASRQANWQRSRVRRTPTLFRGRFSQGCRDAAMSGTAPITCPVAALAQRPADRQAEKLRSTYSCPDSELGEECMGTQCRQESEGHQGISRMRRTKGRNEPPRAITAQH